MSRALEVKEKEFQQRRTEFEEQNKIVMMHNDQLQESMDRFNMEKESFEKKAFAVKQQGEMDQMDSEKIGFFKTNKELIQEEMNNCR